MFEYTKDFEWKPVKVVKEIKLICRGKDTGVAVFPDQYEEGMWRIYYGDGSSEDYYNLTRAKDNARKYAQRKLNNESSITSTIAEGDLAV